MVACVFGNAAVEANRIRPTTARPGVLACSSALACPVSIDAGRSGGFALFPGRHAGRVRHERGIMMAALREPEQFEKSGGCPRCYPGDEDTPPRSLPNKSQLLTTSSSSSRTSAPSTILLERRRAHQHIRLADIS
jgi:hypothetical protein